MVQHPNSPPHKNLPETLEKVPQAKLGPGGLDATIGLTQLKAIDIIL